MEVLGQYLYGECLERLEQSEALNDLNNLNGVGVNPITSWPDSNENLLTMAYRF